MLQQTIRFYNNCSEYHINMKIARIKSICEHVRNPCLEHLGDIEPGTYKDIPYHDLLQEVYVMVYFNVGGVSFPVLTKFEFRNCQDIKFYDDNGNIMIKLIEGNCFDRIR